MPDTTPQETLDTNASELRLNRLETAWRDWRPGAAPPRWQDHLPRDDEPCSPDRIFYLVQKDIECRVKAGVPALLAEAYFEHPRLQQEDARLDSERQVELIRWEYQQRWNQCDPARRGEYESAFPQHAEALRDLRPTSPCPRCHKILVLEETMQTVVCPACSSNFAVIHGGLPPFVAEASPAVAALPELDLRRYELSEELGQGGMGEVYRCSDPALGRDLAIKVIKAKYRGLAEAERRFLREARVTGSLQHPGIVPVHNLGRLGDGRLHYTMRLVRGRTFADILKEEAGNPARLPYLLTIFEKICEAAAYAHSKRVIHRDLKPHNVMVGRFGEVQVMDWGLAKVLTPEESTAAPEETPDAASTRILTEGPDTPVERTRTGSGLGTPAYMSPEQALGEWDAVDERTDVFALGSILCEMLTGQPAYRGTDGNDVYRRAKRGDVAEAMQHLEECDADASLKELCRECLSLKREGRPRNAEVVAERVRKYQAEVQDRLRQAELERVAAETRAREEQARAIVEQERTREALARVKAERRARGRTLALAGAILLLFAGGSAVAWWRQQLHAAAQARQEQTNRDALAGLERSRKLLEEGWRHHDLAKLADAKTEAERAADIARSGGASDTVEQQVAAFQTEVQQRLERTQKNERLLRDLLDIALPHETKTYRESGSGLMVMAMAEPSVEEQYAAAFHRRWSDVDVENEAAAEVAARLQEEPEAVVQGMIAGLDGWMVERRRQQRPEAEWRRLLEVVERLDPSEPRRQLRSLLTGAAPPSAASVARLLTGQPPWLALWELVRGNDWRRLRQLRGRMQVEDEPVLTVLILSQANSAVGDMAGTEEVLRLALARHPDEVSLLDALGKVLERQGRLAEAIGCYRAARARHPGLGVSLGIALGKAGKSAEGEAVLRDLVRQKPQNPESFYFLGYTLDIQDKHAEAEAAVRRAIALKPNFAEAYNGLGIALKAQGKAVEAEAAFRKAIALKPDYAEPYVTLGAILNDEQKNHVGAEAAFRKAIALNPDEAVAHFNLGVALNALGKPVEAEAAYRKALALKPDDALAYISLGNTLKAQGKPVEAEAAYRRAIALKPDFAEAYNNLGVYLEDEQKNHVEAEAAFRKAIALKPDYALAYFSLGNALNAQGKPMEAEAAYRKAIAFKPDTAEAYINLGNALKAQGKPVEAEAAYRKAIALKPDKAVAYFNLGVALKDQGKPAAAEAAYRKAITLKPDFAEAYNSLGAILNDEQKNHVQAEAAFRKAIALNSGLRLGVLQPRQRPKSPGEACGGRGGLPQGHCPQAGLREGVQRPRQCFKRAGKACGRGSGLPQGHRAQAGFRRGIL